MDYYYSETTQPLIILHNHSSVKEQKEALSLICDHPKTADKIFNLR